MHQCLYSTAWKVRIDFTEVSTCDQIVGVYGHDFPCSLSSQTSRIWSSVHFATGDSRGVVGDLTLVFFVGVQQSVSESISEDIRLFAMAKGGCPPEIRPPLYISVPGVHVSLGNYTVRGRAYLVRVMICWPAARCLNYGSVTYITGIIDSAV